MQNVIFSSFYHLLNALSLFHVCFVANVYSAYVLYQIRDLKLVIAPSNLRCVDFKIHLVFYFSLLNMLLVFHELSFVLKICLRMGNLKIWPVLVLKLAMLLNLLLPLGQSDPQGISFKMITLWVI